jgi:4'-phosphopantetheinyl transferase EntD
MPLSGLFDSQVVVHCGIPGALWSQAELYPEELRALERAVDKRRQEYAATRLLARRAFAELGLASAPLPNRKDRSPIWPRGVVGSLTHTDGFCAVAVAREGTLRALGIDAERQGRFGRDLFSRVLTPQEVSFVESFASEQHERIATLVFSAKESFYKCQHPITGRFLGFQDVELDFELAAGSFSVRVLVDDPRLSGSQAWVGRFVEHDGVVVTAVSCPP